MKFLENSENVNSSKFTEKHSNSEIKKYRWSKKASILSGNKSSLMSSGFGQSENGKQKHINISDNEMVMALQLQLEKEEKRILKIQQDSKRQNDAYKRIFENQRIKIKDLEESIRKLNKEKNDLKKDQKVLNELNIFLQRRVHFLEENSKNINTIKSKKTNNDRTSHNKFFNEPESKDLQIFSHTPNDTLEITPNMDSPMWMKSMEFKEYNPQYNSIQNSHEKSQKNIKKKLNIVPKEFRQDHFSFNNKNKKNLMIDISQEDNSDEENNEEIILPSKKNKNNNKKKKLEILIPENNSESSENNQNNFKSSSNSSLSLKHNRPDSVIKIKKTDNDNFGKNKPQILSNQATMKLSINVPEDKPIVYQVKSTKINKKIYFDEIDQTSKFKKTQNYDQNNIFRQKTKEGIFGKKKKESQKQIIIDQTNKAKNKKDISKKIFSTSYLPFEKQQTSQQIYISHKRLKKRNINNGYLASNKKSKRKEDLTLVTDKNTLSKKKKDFKKPFHSKIVSIDVDAEPLSVRNPVTKNANVFEMSQFGVNNKRVSKERLLNMQRIKTEPLLQNSTEEYFESSHQLDEDEKSQKEKIINYHKSVNALEPNSQSNNERETCDFSEYQSDSYSEKKSTNYQSSCTRRKIKSNFNHNFNLSSNIKHKRKTENYRPGKNSHYNEVFETFENSKNIFKKLSKSPIKNVQINNHKLSNKNFVGNKHKTSQNSSVSKKFFKYNFDKKISEKILSLKKETKKSKKNISTFKKNIKSEYISNYPFSNFSSKVAVIGQKDKTTNPSYETPLNMFSHDKIIGEKKKQKIKKNSKKTNPKNIVSLCNKPDTNKKSIWSHKKKDSSKFNPQSHQLFKIVNRITIDKNLSRRSSHDKSNFSQTKQAVNMKIPVMNQTQEIKSKLNQNEKYFSVQSMKKEQNMNNNFNSNNDKDNNISIFNSQNPYNSSKKNL